MTTNLLPSGAATTEPLSASDGSARHRTHNRFARRILLVVAAGVASLVLGTALPQPAAAAELSNTTQSSSGAYLQSAGVCGGNFSFEIRSIGFEYLALGVSEGSGFSWGAWTAVPQDARFRYNLPYSYQNKVYVVYGADWVNGAWELRVVATSFDRIMNGNNFSTSYC